jgi:hypothetical protein
VLWRFEAGRATEKRQGAAAVQNLAAFLRRSAKTGHGFYLIALALGGSKKSRDWRRQIGLPLLKSSSQPPQSHPDDGAVLLRTK